jgi:general secretion pathway protein C
VIAAVSFSIVDGLMLYVRSQMWPAEPPRWSFMSSMRQALRDRDPINWSIIADRNIFNADGLIPPPFNSGDKFDEKNAVPSHLDITLIATVVHSDPEQSVAAFHLKDSPGPAVFRKGASIDGMATIVMIRRGRVYLRSGDSRRLEYIEMPQRDSPITLGEFGTGTAGITRSGSGDFKVDRATFEAETRDLASLLQQARAIPVMGMNGGIEGFRIESIQSGSVFESLGLQRGDVIKKVNGQTVNSVSRAAELFNFLKGGESIKLEVSRNGKNEALNYSLR